MMLYGGRNNSGKGKEEEEEPGLLGKRKTAAGDEEDKASPVLKDRREDKKKGTEWEFPALEKVEEDRGLLDMSINCTKYGEEVLRRVVEWVYGIQEKPGEEGFESRDWESKQEKSKPWRTWEFRKEEEGKGLGLKDRGRRSWG
ncbi:hypothetical protein BY996DRAFT_6528529 [Phakopsora pachyrhizi]|nr:hypothetical protein BY996DRAFT_6528529 [Phakopsora pachyrhizi]